MMVEHQFVIWGTHCDCGEDCFILQNQFHPWVQCDFVVKMNCQKCGKEIMISQKEAMEFYNEKIYSCFHSVKGDIIDLGCGGGFITQFIANLDHVREVFGLDIQDSTVGKENKVTFIKDDISNISKYFKEKSVDYIVHRDVFMFISDTKQYFDDVSKIVKRGVIQLGWYMKDNVRMLNQMHPEEIKTELEKKGFHVKLSYLDWYKCGYLIEANK